MTQFFAILLVVWLMGNMLATVYILIELEDIMWNIEHEGWKVGHIVFVIIFIPAIILSAIIFAVIFLLGLLFVGLEKVLTMPLSKKR